MFPKCLCDAAQLFHPRPRPPLSGEGFACFSICSRGVFHNTFDRSVPRKPHPSGRGQGAQYEDPHFREALRPAQGRELCRTAPPFRPGSFTISLFCPIRHCLAFHHDTSLSSLCPCNIDHSPIFGKEKLWLWATESPVFALFDKIEEINYHKLQPVKEVKNGRKDRRGYRWIGPL